MGNDGRAQRRTQEETAAAEALYGRELLEEVAALTAAVSARRDDLRALMAWGAKVSTAHKAAEDRWHASGRPWPEVGDGDTVGVLSGLQALADLAVEVGIYDSLLDPTITPPSDAPALASTGGPS